ncbi:hypothetical protein D3C83_273670 [compost metagenome]
MLLSSTRMRRCALPAPARSALDGAVGTKPAAGVMPRAESAVPLPSSSKFSITGKPRSPRCQWRRTWVPR